MTIYRGPGGAGDATNDAIVNAVAAYATSAASSADNAANSSSAASTSATNASTSATNAASSASQAATSASNSAASASTASTQASTATTQASNAAASATAASSSAASASTYASNAASSASTATSKAAEAETYAIRAETAETNAETAYANTLDIFGDAADVANAVAAASTSATNAANSATTAASSATAASGSATTAGNYASAALNSANTANAEASEAQSAANTAVAALQSAQTIYGGLDDVTAAVDDAEAFAVQSANSATASSASSSAAQTSANTATTQATNAANSATQAAASASSAAAIVTGVASNRPSIRPSLLLDFANTKQLDPRITFSRPTTATYYDGKTVVKAEENLLKYSQEFDNATWTKSGSTVTANTVAAPDGSSTADTLSATVGSVRPKVTGTASFTSGYAYTLSFYVKAGTRNFVQINNSGDAQAYANFDVTTGAGVVGSKGSKTTSSITDVGNGWYRCIASFDNTTAFSTASGILIATSATDPYGGTTFVGTGAENVYIWGAQLEQRSTVTAYTPTTTAPITNYIPALQTAAAGVPRFDHDPVTGESKGFLIEEQRTNLLTYSSNFDNAAWAKSNSTVTANTVVAPDGTLSGNKIIPNNGQTGGNVYQSFSVTASTAYTFSIRAKAGEQSTISFVSNLTGTFRANIFNLSNGTVTPGTGWSATIQAIGNGWYICTATATADVTASKQFQISNNSAGWTGDGYSGVFIWGAQLEAGSFPTSYIPTVASQVTRSADSASMTGSNFSSWYRADEGTVYGEALTFGINAGAGASAVYAFSDGATSNRIRLNRIGSTNLTADIATNAGAQVAIASTVANNAFFKHGLTYKFNDSAASTSGEAVGTDTSCSIPVVTQFQLGVLISTGPMSGYLRKLAYYPKRLSNTELQGLTS